MTQGRYADAYDAVRKMVNANPAITLRALSAALAERGLTAARRNGEAKPFTKQQIRRFVIAMGLRRIDGRTLAAKASRQSSRNND